jgi:hypothetical protein
MLEARPSFIHYHFRMSSRNLRLLTKDRVGNGRAVPSLGIISLNGFWYAYADTPFTDHRNVPVPVLLWASSIKPLVSGPTRLNFLFTQSV